MRKVIGVICLIASGAAFLYVLYGCWVNRQYEQYAKEVDGLEDTYTTGTPESFSVDWDSLFSLCGDVVGWIRMDPDISYPVVHSGDNSYYLRRGLDGEYNPNGSLFMDGNNQALTDAHVIIYGHNMRSGTMFGKLRQYQDPAYAKEHDVIRLYTPDGSCHLYQIFSVLPTEDGSWAFRTVSSQGIDISQFLEQAKASSTYWNDDLLLDENSQILSLSTCRGKSGGRLRLMVSAVYIGEEQCENEN